jgi:hypothetical protein
VTATDVVTATRSVVAARVTAPARIAPVTDVVPARAVGASGPGRAGVLAPRAARLAVRARLPVWARRPVRPGVAIRLGLSGGAWFALGTRFAGRLPRPVAEGGVGAGAAARRHGPAVGHQPHLRPVRFRHRGTVG